MSRNLTKNVLKILNIYCWYYKLIFSIFFFISQCVVRVPPSSHSVFTVIPLIPIGHSVIA